MVQHEVTAYLTSHIIAFDVQVHDNVLQILSGGAGTVYGPGGFMPGHSEYLHAVQIAVDRQGLRCQVQDPTGRVRERLSWSFDLPPVDRWQSVNEISADSLPGPVDMSRELVAFRIRGRCAQLNRGKSDQTLLCGVDSGEGVEPVWVGLDEDSRRLLVRVVPITGHGWKIWKGPRLAAATPFDFQVAFHPGMGRGGILFRAIAAASWSTMTSTSPKGTEDLKGPGRWAIGHGQSGPEDRSFIGDSLKVTIARKTPNFE